MWEKRRTEGAYRDKERIMWACGGEQFKNHQGIPKKKKKPKKILGGMI